MSIRTFCPHCRKGYRVGDELEGQKVRCRECTKGFVVSSEAEEPKKPPEPARKSVSSPSRSSRPRIDADGEAPRTRKKVVAASESRPTYLGWIIGGAAAALLMLIGSIAALAWAVRTPPVDSQTRGAVAVRDSSVANRSADNPPSQRTKPTDDLALSQADDASGSGGSLKNLGALKAATVFVKVDADNLSASGSGFLLKHDGEDAYVVTNNHVIDPHFEFDTSRVVTTPRMASPTLPGRRPLPGRAQQNRTVTVKHHQVVTAKNASVHQAFSPAPDDSASPARPCLPLESRLCEVWRLLLRARSRSIA